MLQPVIPAIIMFLITVGIASVLISPVKAFPRKSPVANFYWTGFWGFLTLLTALSGGSSTLMLLGLDPDHFINNAIISAAIAAFVCFVVFGWFHLSSKAIVGLYRRVRGLKPI